MSSRTWPNTSGGGVTSLNTLTGDLTLAAGTNITLSTVGNTITISSTDAAAITSINSDHTAAQTLSIGTAGTDFALVDAGSGSHVFNLPTASASNRGALSSADWTTFNNKQSSLTLGNLTDAGTDGIVVTGGTGAVVGSGTSLAQHVADTTHNGYLSSADWNTFNGKQASGSYITALTGDGTAAGPGSSALTLATVNSNVGSFTYASITVNAKGLITAASSGTTPGTVSTVSVVSANGLAGTVATPTSTPAITLSTTITGLLQGNGTAISAATTTGSGSVVLATNAVLVTPALGTPSALVGTNITGTASGLTAGTVTTNANLTGDVTSSGNATTAASTQANIDTLSKSSGVSVHGTNTNNDAAAGYVGEYLTVSKVYSAATSITNNTDTNVTASALALTAGDWDVQGSVGFISASGTSITNMAAAISKTTGSLPALDTESVPTGGECRIDSGYGAIVPGNGFVTSIVIPRTRVSVSGNTNIFLVARASFTVSTLTISGSLTARRVR